MTIIRSGLIVATCLWLLMLTDDEPMEPWFLVFPAIAVLLYVVYLIAAVVRGRTVWAETMLVGLALVPLVVGMAVAVLAGVWGGVRWLRSRRDVSHAEHAATGRP